MSRSFRRSNPLQLRLPVPDGWGGPPAGKPAAPRRPARRNLFGTESAEAMAGYVRQHLSDRLDALFRDPATFLADLLDGLGAAAGFAEAIDTGDRDGSRAAAGELRRVRHALAAVGVPLDRHGLLDVLQWGLFPELHREEYADEFGVRERIAAAGRAKAAREAVLVAKTPAGLTPAEKAEVEGLREPVAVTLPCPECGRKPRPRKDVCGGCGGPPRAVVQPGGLVPANGGQRVGADRLRAAVGEMMRAG